MCVFNVSGTKTSSLNGYVFGSSYGWEESFTQPTVPQAAAVRKLTRHIGLAIRQPLADASVFLFHTPGPLEHKYSENTRIETHQLA